MSAPLPHPNHTDGCLGCAAIADVRAWIVRESRKDADSRKSRAAAPAHQEATMSTCQFCAAPAVLHAEWRTSNGLTVVAERVTCAQHSDALTRWSGQVTVTMLPVD